MNVLSVFLVDYAPTMLTTYKVAICKLRVYYCLGHRHLATAANRAVAQRYENGMFAALGHLFVDV